MPIPEFELNENETNDAVLREEFIDYTRNLLAYIVANGVEDNVNTTPVTPQLETPMQRAWEEVLPLFQELQGNMQQINQEAIIPHGLYGAQLRFKLANVAWWSQQVSAAEQNSQTALWIANIKRLLDSIDTLLDSILAALGAGSALKELKDSIKNGTQLILN